MKSPDTAIKIEAKSVEAAVVMASVKLGVPPESVEYEILKEPKAGLLSFFTGSKAEIKAWPRVQSRHDRHQSRDGRKGAERSGGQQAGGRNDNRGNRQGQGQGGDRQRQGKRQDDNGDRRHQAKGRPQPTERPAREERAPAEPLSPETIATLEVEIRNFCKELCEKIVGETVHVTSKMDTEKLQLEIDNAAIAEMIQTQTKFIESLEHVLRKKPRHLKQELPFRIFIDAQGSRKGRETELARIAQERADHVAETGQKIVLDYKSASDRKIVHMTLEKDDRVYTKSIGSGASRKLMILPSRGRKPAAEEASEENDA